VREGTGWVSAHEGRGEETYLARRSVPSNVISCSTRRWTSAMSRCRSIMFNFVLRDALEI
jgi:hypothetical protein